MASRRGRVWSAFFPAALALSAAAAGAAVSAAALAQIQIMDVDGRALEPFKPAATANVIFFVATDCPMSNSYAPEIQRVCREYGSRGVGCSLIYEDLDTAASDAHLEDQVRRHLQEYRFAGIPAAVDRSRAVAKHAKASVTPMAVVIDRAGEVRYRGRIDNLYAAFGRQRQQVTERDLQNALDALLSGRPVSRPETKALGCYIVDPEVLRKK